MSIIFDSIPQLFKWYPWYVNEQICNWIGVTFFQHIYFIFKADVDQVKPCFHNNSCLLFLSKLYFFIFTLTYIHFNFIHCKAQLNNCIDWILWHYINKNYYYVVAGPIAWVQEQMQDGVDPRDLLSRLLAPDTEIPSDFDDLTIWKIIINMLAEPPRRLKLKEVNTLDDVVHLLKTSNKIMVLTGAGVSGCPVVDRSILAPRPFQITKKIIFKNCVLQIQYKTVLYSELFRHNSVDGPKADCCSWAYQLFNIIQDWHKFT